MGGVGGRRRSHRWRGLPLGLLIARYFVYVLLCALLPAVVSTYVFVASIDNGSLYPANYGVNNLDRVSSELATAECFDAAAIPSAYWYAHFSASGEVLETDMDEAQLSSSRAVVADAAGSGAPSSLAADTTGPAGLALAGSYTYAGFALADGSWCVLACDLVPQFVTRELRDSLPDPQTMHLATLALSFVTPLVVFAIRASHVITRKMQPLLSVARRVGSRDLDFTVGTSDVRQISDVLVAMDEMRGELRDSLERQWEAERRQRDQVAALAHDLKTPLTVVRANAELLAKSEALAGEDRSCAADIARAARKLDDYVGLLIEASRSGALDGSPGAEAPDRYAPAPDASSKPEPKVVPLPSASAPRGGEPAGRICAVPVADFVHTLAREARALLRASGMAPRLMPEGCAERALPDVLPGVLLIDETAVRRAVMNVVANAVDHRCLAGEVGLSFLVLAADDRPLSAPAAPVSAEFPSHAARLVITVDDDGPGFSPEALARGTERFFRDNPARTRNEGTLDLGHAARVHSGLGLAIADDAVRAAGGTLVLANRTGTAGDIEGARVTLTIPVGLPSDATREPR